MESLEKTLQSRIPAWFAPSVNWSAQFVLHGPRYIPLFVRRLPLNLLCSCGALYVRGVLMGYGGHAPHVDA